MFNANRRSMKSQNLKPAMGCLFLLITVRSPLCRPRIGRHGRQTGGANLKSPIPT
jgi:hypothetical protein